LALLSSLIIARMSRPLNLKIREGGEKKEKRERGRDRER
jgi:hypothetical protein